MEIKYTVNFTPVNVRALLIFISVFECFVATIMKSKRKTFLFYWISQLCFCLLLFVLPVYATNNSQDVQVMFLKTFAEKCDQQNNIWIGGTENLHFIKDINEGSIYRVKGIKQSHIKDAILKDGRVWVNTHNGLYYILPSNPEQAQRIDGLENTIVVKLYFDNGDIVALDWKRNLFHVDVQANKAIPIEQVNSLSLFKITDSIQTEDPDFLKNKVWLIGRDEEGLKLIDKNNFDLLRNIPEFDGVTISSLQEVNGYVWALTKTDGLYRINLKNNSGDEPLDIEVEHISETRNQAITRLLKINGKLLVGTLGSGAFIVDSEDVEKVINISSLHGEMINFVDESDNYVWIVGDFKGDVVRINKKDMQDVAITSTLQSEKIIDVKAYSGYLWVLTSNGTVYKVSEKNIQDVSRVTSLDNKKVTKMKVIEDSLFFESFKGAFVVSGSNKNVQYVRGLEGKRINAIYLKDGQYWTETYDHRIYRIDPQAPNNAIYLRELDGINIWNIMERDGNYIIASNDGAYIVHKNNLNSASLIPQTKSHKVTSLLIYCDSLLIGTLEGYQRHLLKDILN